MMHSQLLFWTFPEFLLGGPDPWRGHAPCFGKSKLGRFELNGASSLSLLQLAKILALTAAAEEEWPL